MSRGPVANPRAALLAMDSVDESLHSASEVSRLRESERLRPLVFVSSHQVSEDDESVNSFGLFGRSRPSEHLSDPRPVIAKRVAISGSTNDGHRERPTEPVAETLESAAGNRADCCRVGGDQRGLDQISRVTSADS